MKKIEDILAVCIEDVKSGRLTLEECLTTFPSVREELEPLLRLALSIERPPDFKPSVDFKIRAKVGLMDYIRDSEKKSRHVFGTFNLGLSTGWLRTAAIVLIIVVVISASSTGTAYASQGSLPGDILYPVKVATENVRRTFTFGDEARIDLELSFAGTRLEEMEALANDKPEKIALAVDAYGDNMARAENRAEEAVGGGYRERLETVARTTSGHLSVIDRIGDIVAPADKGQVGKAAEIALDVQLEVLGALAEEDPVKAMGINLQTMQHRLQRAEETVDKGETPEAEKALGQFEEMRKFEEDLSTKARNAGYDTKAADALLEQSVSKKMEIAEKVHGKKSGNNISDPEGHPGQSAGSQGGGNGNPHQQDSSDNVSGEAGSTQDEQGSSSEEPGNGGYGPGGPGEQPGDTDSPRGPGNAPEDPGDGSGPGKNTD